MTPGNKMEFLPHELITEIFSWLPVKSLLRFKAACKSWRDTIQEHNFARLHMMRCSIIYPAIMWEVYTGKPDSGNNTESFTCLGNFSGLMLERCSSTNKYRIKNPSTKYILHLSSPKHIEPAIMFLKFITKTKEYKLVSYHLDKTRNSLGFEVLTIGTDSAWRPLDATANSQYANHGKVRGRLIGDVLYVFGASVAGDPGVICLDMATEQFKEVTIPSCLFPDWNNVRIAEWNRKFSITKVVQEQMHIWILEDYKKCKWGDQKTVVSLTPLILNDHPQLTECGNVYIAGKNLAFQDKRRNLFVYDIRSGKVRCLASAPSGNECCVPYRPSMVHFRGMQPE